MTELTHKLNAVFTAKCAQWLAQSKTYRFLMVFGIVAGLVTIALFVTLMTRPTTPIKIAVINTPTPQVATVVSFTATPTAAATFAVTGTPIVVVTTTPAVVNTPEVTPTTTLDNCNEGDTIATDLSALWLKSTEGRFSAAGNETAPGFGEDDDKKGWHSYGISSSKTETKMVTLDGQTYTLYILKTYVFGKKDTSRKIVELPVVIGMTYPNGKFISSIPNFDRVDEKELIDSTIVPFGSFFAFSLPGDSNGVAWNDCINGTNSLPLDKNMSKAYCKIGKQLQPNADTLIALEKGENLPDGYFLMGAWLNSIKIKSGVVQLDAPLTCKQ